MRSSRAARRAGKKEAALATEKARRALAATGLMIRRLGRWRVGFSSVHFSPMWKIPSKRQLWYAQLCSGRTGFGGYSISKEQDLMTEGPRVFRAEPNRLQPHHFRGAGAHTGTDPDTKMCPNSAS
jgi:hypothetical protein